MATLLAAGAGAFAGAFTTFSAELSSVKEILLARRRSYRCSRWPMISTNRATRPREEKSMEMLKRVGAAMHPDRSRRGQSSVMALTVVFS
ncbi:MAG TPA: hypothetical protein VML54_00105 [Candidatus Limnocylindrales bacterium]|nr:hypothetical protein [Candidatus Limnocylindrales bacterium]